MFRQLIATLLATVALQAFAGVDINQASRAELEQLPRVGPSLAGKILAARQNAAFRDWNDVVERVPGIGQASAAKLSQAGLTVAGRAYSAPADAPTKPAKPRKSAEKPAS